MSKVKFKKPSTKKKSNRRFGHIRTKNYDCFFLLFPLIPIVLLLDWIDTKYYKSLKWSNRTADKVLNRFLPKAAEYDEKTDSFYYNTSWYSYHAVPFGYRNWYQKFKDELDDYLINNYHPEGYTKTVEKGDTYYDPEIAFKKILDKSPKV